MSIYKDILKENIYIKSLNSENFSMNDVYILDEAVNTFNDLPPKWKREAASTYSGGLGGKDSKVEVIAATKKIKDANSIISVLRKTFRRDGAALVWIEIDGDPLVAVIKNDYENSYKLMNPSGDILRKTIKKTVYGTGKYDSRMQQYIPPKYYDTFENDLKPNEAADKMWGLAYTVIDNMNKALDNPRESVFDLAKELKFEVRVMYADKERLAKSKERKETRTVKDDSFSKNRKEVIKKIAGSKIDSLVDDVKNELEKQVDAAVNGEKFDLKEIQERLYFINNIVKELNDVLAKDNLRFTNSYDKSLSYDLKYLIRDLKAMK